MSRGPINAAVAESTRMQPSNALLTMFGGSSGAVRIQDVSKRRTTTLTFTLFRVRRWSEETGGHPQDAGHPFCLTTSRTSLRLAARAQLVRFSHLCNILRASMARTPFTVHSRQLSRDSSTDPPQGDAEYSHFL